MVDSVDRLVTEAEQRARQTCWCADKRKPCQYHEGYGDGLDKLASALRGVGEERDRLRVALEEAAGRLHSVAILHDEQRKLHPCVACWRLGMDGERRAAAALAGPENPEEGER